MSDNSVKPGKNIVIWYDGTDNEFGDTSFSAVKLYAALVINNEQVGYYHPSVGTTDAPASRTSLGKEWSRLDGLAFAGGFMDNVEDAYRYLMQQYADNDQNLYVWVFLRPLFGPSVGWHSAWHGSSISRYRADIEPGSGVVGDTFRSHQSDPEQQCVAVESKGSLIGRGSDRTCDLRPGGGVL